MGPYLDQNPFRKMSVFSTFWTCFIYRLERRFLFLQYRKTHFPGLYRLKKKVEKIAIFGPKPWVNPFRKMSIFSTFWTWCFYSLERPLFVLEYGKRYFHGLHRLKKKSWKNSHCGPKPWFNPFGKVSIFSTLWTWFFYSVERPFFVLEYRKKHFVGLYCLNKKLTKIAIFGPKLWVNTFWKMSIFSTFWTCCFYSLKRRFSF